MAHIVDNKLGLDINEIMLPHTILMRANIEDRVPTAHIMYRFYEMRQVYSTILKGMVNTKFCDGIISVINFNLEVKKVARHKTAIAQ